MHNTTRRRAGLAAALLLAVGTSAGGRAAPVMAADELAPRLHEESASEREPEPQTPPALAPGLQQPRPTWNEDDPYLRSLIDPFESNAARDQRFGRENALTTPRVDPDF